MISLLPNSTLLLASGAPDITALDKFKDFVNRWSVPQYSLPLFCILMFAAFFWYRKWTKPAIFWPLMIGFTVVYFAFIPLDDSYASILKKPDNVPISMMVFLTLYFLWLGLRQAAINDQNMEIGKPLIEEDREDKVLCWPDLVYSELLAMVLCTVVLIVWSVLLKAPLESPANPAGPPNPSKAPWYFLGLQELLVYFDPWMAGVVLPGLIILGLAAMPYIDTNPKGNGYYTFKERKFAILTWMFGYLILWCVLIVFGTFLRGPNWNFFGPFQVWDPHRVDPLTNINISDVWYVVLLGGKLPENILVREWPGMVLTVFWLGALPVLMTRIGFFGRLRSQMGFSRYYLMAVLFVIMLLVPVKMVGRWTFNLKYIIAMPEINFNL
ncbi:MAG: hypothetical protein KJZ69_00060 [Phycisphaerales bacterium]|nr:hypothetical protein [Phycisphaerales bacterium]